jgi:hypothetical protein
MVVMVMAKVVVVVHQPALSSVVFTIIIIITMNSSSSSSSSMTNQPTNQPITLHRSAQCAFALCPLLPATRKSGGSKREERQSSSLGDG